MLKYSCNIIIIKMLISTLFIVFSSILTFTNGQQNGPPKILPIAAADNYPEASTVNLICTVSAGLRQSLSLAWAKDGNIISDSSDDESRAPNVFIENAGDISILRIRNATHINSGRYTCMAKNPLGEDSTSVNIVINVQTNIVEMKWTKLVYDTEVGLNQDLSIECDATGQPKPTISWLRHPNNIIKSSYRNLSHNNNSVLTKEVIDKTTIVSHGKILKIPKAGHQDSGVYECVARNNAHQDLRRLIQITVRGK